MLTDGQCAFFQANGYVTVDGFLSPDGLAEARRELAALLSRPADAPDGVAFSREPPGSPGTVDSANPERIWMIFDSPLAGRWWLDNVRDPRIAEVMARLLGPDVNFHNGKVRVKPPHYTAHQCWHQDWPYERHDRPELAAALIYTDDTWRGAAATEVVPGSHLNGEWPHDESNCIPDDAVAAFGREPVALEVRAGTLAVIHVLLVHRAAPNLTGITRSAIINEYKSAAARDQWNNRCAFAELPIARRGKAV